MKRLMFSIFLGQALLGFLASEPLVVSAKEESIPMSVAIVDVSSCSAHREHPHKNTVSATKSDCFTEEECILQTEIPVFERIARVSGIAQSAIKGFANHTKPMLGRQKFSGAAFFIEPSPHHSVVLRV